MPVKYVFKLIRWKNLLFLTIIMVLIKYALFTLLDADTFLSSLHFSILVISVLFITAAGYVINDIHDVIADEINKPEKVIIDKYIQKEEARFLYDILNVIGILLGFATAYFVHKVSFSLIFVIASILLYKYSNYLKNKFLIGNLIISFLAFLSIFLIGIFDLVPATDSSNRPDQLHAFLVIIAIGIFAFILTFIREIVKDIEDIPGDRKTGADTLPIRLGIAKTKSVLIGLTFLVLLLVLLYTYYFLDGKWYASLYVSLLLIAPLGYFIYKLKYASKIENFHFLSNLLKWIMLSGILSVLLF